MANEYFQAGSVPAPNSPGSSAVMRNEFGSVAAAFDKLPVMAGHQNEIVVVNSSGTSLITSGVPIANYVTKDGVFTLTNKTIAWADNTFPGFGTAATKNAGTASGNVPILAGASKLPALDGSLLTKLNVNQAGTIVDVAHGGTGVTSVNDAQVVLGIDLKADADDAVLTGAPTAPTPPTGDNSARIATTYFVTNTIADIGSFAPSNAAPLMDGVASSGVGALGSRDDHRHPTDTTRAPLASPALTGTPTAPTPAVGDNDTSIATTAFVNAEIAADRPYSTTNPLMNGTAAQGVAANVSRSDHVHPTDTTRAPLASPTFTGDPKAPTPATSDNDTSIATTAFVQSLLAQQPPAGMQPSNNVPLMDGTAAAGTGVSGARDDHRHPSDTSRLALAGGAMTGALTITVNIAGAALRVTQTGAGNVAVFEDSANPDSSPVVIDASGRLVVGETQAMSFPLSSTTLELASVQTHGTIQQDGSMAAATYNAGATTAPNLVLARSKNPTRGSTLTPVVADDSLGRILFQGSDGQAIATGAGWVRGAAIEALADGNASAGVLPGRLSFQTTGQGTNPVERMRIDSTGLVALQGISGLAIARTTVTAPATTDGNVFSGTYTPIVDAANRINVAAVTLNAAQYMRVGNTVTVSGALSVQASAAGNMEFDLSLPVASNLTSFFQCAGSLSSHASVASASGAIYGDSARDVARIRVVPTATTNISYSFNFTYRVA